MVIYVGELKGSRRKSENMINRCIITLDADNIPPGMTDNVLKLVDGLSCAYAIYSTRKHANEKPRLRILIPLDRDVTPEEYEAIARKLAEFIGMDLMDSSTFEPSRLMYWPSHSKDSEWVFTYNDKPFVSADGMLKMYKDWRDTTQWSGVLKEKDYLNKEASKQKDPTNKDGIVGAFCKIYNIHRVIETFLPDVYQIGTMPNTYTYINGSVANGAHIYGDDAFLYSYHATDPCSKTLCNSFDLVRIHKFRELDEIAKDGTPANRLPSYIESCRLAQSDKEVADLLAVEKYQKAVDEFNINYGGQVDTASIVNDDIEWVKKIDRSINTGQIERNAKNAVLILKNDPGIKGRLVFDRFAQRFLTNSKLPWHNDKRQYPCIWDDSDDAMLRIYVSEIYEGFTGKNLIDDALYKIMEDYSIHVVQNYFNSLVWDKTKRLETILIDYLGAKDNIYVRQATKKMLCAAVKMVMTEKPVKFDQMLVLEGPQGVGKSTFLQKLGREWFTDNIKDLNNKDTLLIMQKCLIAEIAELEAFNKTNINRLKQFMSTQMDTFRAPYDRRAKDHPRHCVFFGTTNDSEYLRDATGERRFWPVEIKINEPTKSIFEELDSEVGQIWAEAVACYKTEKLYIESPEAKQIELATQKSKKVVDPWEDVILEYLDRKVPENWWERSPNEQKSFWTFAKDDKETKNLIERDKFCAREILVVCLGIDEKHQSFNDRKRVLSIGKTLIDWSYKDSVRFGTYYGKTNGFVKKSRKD